MSSSHKTGFCIALAAAAVSAHGLMESPPSRSWLCGAITKPDHITNGTAKYPVCSTAFAINPLAAYNFMAVVTHSWGRAKVNPLPKHVCGFAGESWNGAETPWDVPMAWPAQPMAPGPRPITWNISWGPHYDDTKDFSYWITKADFVFSPTRALTWDDFETIPFCVVAYDDKHPTANPRVSADKAAARITTTCDMPQRQGHHVIYGEWGRIEPTIERFHGCIDAAFGGPAAVPAQSRERGVSPVPFVIDALGRTRRPAMPRQGRTRIHYPSPR